MTFSNLNRKAIVNRLQKERFDCLVIGGGITGAGIALDAATRGLKAALVDKQDFAAGTSSRSTKLIHGGLRYLKNFEFRMVSEVGKERAIVFENGPHVTKSEWMLLPVYKGGTLRKSTTSFGLKLYDYLAGVNKAERRIMLNREETLLKEPLLREEGLLGGGYYVEYRTDDARLTIEVLKAAVEKGAVALNYTKVAKLLFTDGKVVGAQLRDQFSGDSYEINANFVINATGPWVDEIRELDTAKKTKALQLTKGVHIVVDRVKLPIQQAIYFETHDNRMVFAIPRGNKTYIGTTDTIFNNSPSYASVSPSDIDYLIQAVRSIFPSNEMTSKDIETSWAGVRPLILEKANHPSDISRKDEIWESPTGLLSIAGGKLTGYRKMSEKIVNRIAEKIEKETGRLLPKCRTKTLKLSGGYVGGSKNFPHFIKQQIPDGIKHGLTYYESKELVGFYGSNVQRVFTLMEDRSQEAEKFHLPLLLFGKLEYGIEYEMVATPMDFFYRRTGDLLFNIQSVRTWMDPVIRYLTARFSWTEEKRREYEVELLLAIGNRGPVR